MLHLSKPSIHSYCGDIVSLQLLGDGDLSRADIRWFAEGDTAVIRTFAGEGEGCFRDGVLVTLVKEGEGAVCAQYGGEVFRCLVSVRQAQKADPREEMQHYIADFHIHSTNNHVRGSFSGRTEEFPEDLIRQIHGEGELDCCVITDHGGIIQDKDFFQGFLVDEALAHDGLIVFPGSEGSLRPTFQDRFGLQRKQFGEMVTLNLDTYINTDNMTSFYREISRSFQGFGAFVHPQEAGFDACGIWNCAAREHATEEMKNFIRLVEVGNGAVRGTNISFELTYSDVLDAGFRVAPECASDSHGHYAPGPGRSVIMAPSKSKELFLDAIRNCRVYATSSGLVKLNFSVNGYPMAETLPLADNYDFHVELGLFRDDESARPIQCQVISDYGLAVHTMDCRGKTVLNFTVCSDTARYFYLRLIDSQGRKTWSAPVWTGREFDAPAMDDRLRLLDSTDFTAMEEGSGKTADILLNYDPEKPYESESTAASIVIDLRKPHLVCAVGHSAPIMLRRKMADEGRSQPDRVAQYVGRFRISVSGDGNSWEVCREGLARIYGREEIFAFPERMARYVKFEVLSSLGKESEYPQFADAKVAIGELGVFGLGSQ